MIKIESKLEKVSTTKDLGQISKTMPFDIIKNEEEMKIFEENLENVEFKSKCVSIYLFK